MPATVATITLKDSSNTSRSFDVIDLSGAGTGPFIPAHALIDITGTPISTTNPLTIADGYNAPIRGVTSISTAGRGCILIIGTAGNVDFTMADTSTLASFPVPVGSNFYPFSVTAVVASASGGAVITASYGAK